MKIFEERKSVRSFSKRQVEKEDILKILDSARLAPSAKNRQPWHFYILSDDEKTEVVSEFISALKENNTEETGLATARILKSCSKIILVFMDYKKVEEMGLSLIPDFLSVGACIENALLQATELGIGSLWVYDIVAIQDKLIQKFYPDGKFVSALAFGYEDKVLPRAKKKSLSQIVINKDLEEK